MSKTILQRIQHQMASLSNHFTLVTLFTLVLVSCNAPSEQVDQTSLGQASLVFPGLSPQIRLLEVEIALINGDLTVKSGAGNKIQKNALTLPPRDPSSSSPSLNPSLEFHDLTPGLHRVLARGLDASDGVVLYKIATTVMVLPGARSDVTANTAPGTIKPRSNPAQQIYLERAVGTVMVRVEKPIDAGNNLIYSVQMGIHRAELNAKDTGFAATMWAVPTGRQLGLIVEAKDRVGTVLYQGESVFDLPDVTKEITINLERVDASTPLPSIAALTVEGSGVVGQAQKLKLEVLAGASGSVTLKQARIQWGDGSSETSVLNGATATLDLNHSYTSAGAQTISVQVQNSANRSAQASQVIAITDPQSPPSQNTNSMVRFEVQDVPWNADAVELRIKPEIVQTASDSRGATVEPERVIRLARTNALWTGLANLKKGSRYSLNLAARVDALGQTLQSTQNGTYPMLEPKAGTETLALKFSQLNAPAPGDDLTLQISPAGALLASKNDTKTFTVRAYDKNGIEVSTDGLGLEWLSSNVNQVAVQAQTGNTNQAIATPQVDSGSAFIMVRSQTNPKLVSAPSSVVMAQVYDGVQLVPDEAVVFPPAQLPVVPTSTPNFKDISAPDQAGNVSIGSFTDLEVHAVTETIPEGKAFRTRTPLVLRGTGYPVGTLIMGNESAAIAGRVTRSETRTDFTLLQIEQVAPTDILKSINLALDGKSLRDSGFINLQNTGTQPSLGTRATRAKAGLICKPSGVSADVATFEAEMSIQPVVIPSGTLRWKNNDIRQGVEEFSFKVDYGITLEFVGTASIQAGFKFSYECTPKSPLLETYIPIPVPQIAAFLNLTYTMNPIFSIEGTIKGGPRFEFRGKFAPGTKESGEIGFKYVNGLPVETILKKPEFELKTKEMIPGTQWLQSFAAEFGQVEVGLNLFIGAQGKFNFKPGGRFFALCGIYLSKICGLLNQSLDKTRIDFAQFKIGGKLDLALANVRAVLKVEDDLSKALFGPGGEIGIGSDAINDFFRNVLKLPTDISASANIESTNFPIWRVINDDSGNIIVKNGSDEYKSTGKGQDVLVNASIGDKLNISAKYGYDPSTPVGFGFSDNLAFKGEFYSDSSDRINQFEVSDTDNLSNTLAVSQELCEKAKNSLNKYIRINFIGYNSFLGLEPNAFPTPGYIGSIRLRCSDRVTFVVDNIEVPLESPGIVLVGRKPGKCDEPVRDVEFRAALTTLPPGEWIIDKSEYSVDGFVLDNQSGSTSAVYGPKVIPGISQGLHTLKLTYTAKKGFFPLETKRDEVVTAKFEARVKKADGTLCPPPKPDGDPGRTHGDPHFINPDGVRFDNHSIGEFTYLQPRPGKTGISVQARQELINNQYVFPTMISSLAIKLAGHVIEFRGRKTPPVLLDGQPLEIKDGLYRDLGNGASLLVSNNLYQLVGEGSRIEIPTWQGFFNITYWVPKDGSLEGMLGIPDGDPLNDYVDFPGFNADVFGGNPQNAALADFWRVKDRTNSLFTYDVGEGPETFNKLNPYLKEAPNAVTLAPYVDQAKALLTSTCADSGTSDDALASDLAVDLFYGAQYPATGFSAQNIAAQLCAYEVSGKITNPNLPGVPVVGASVSITSSDLQPCSTATADNGIYTCRLAPIPGGAIPKLTIAVDGATTTAEFTSKAPKGGTLALSKDLEVALTSLRLTGVVTQLEATGVPAVGANVQVQVLNQWQQTTTDANGRYDLAVVFPRSQTASAVQLKFASASTGLIGGKMVDVTLNTGGLLERNENLVLNRSITFTGSVRNSLVPTTPLAGNLVINKSDGTELCRTSVNNGDYNCVAVFGGTGALEPLNLKYVLTGDWGSTTASASVAAGEVNISRNFDLPVTALKLSGKVKFVDGVVYPGAPVYISGDGLPSVSLATDGSGYFETTLTIPVWKALAIVKFEVGVGAGLPPATAQLEIPLTKDALNTGTQDFSVAFEGVQFWRVDGPGRYIGVSSAALAQDGTLYFGQEEGYLFAVTPNGGNAWVFSTYLDTLGYAPSVRVPPAVGLDGTIYLVTSAGPFYALKPDGSKLWTFATMPSGVGCATPALARDGTIYINCENGSLLAISSSGQQRWILERTGFKSNRLTSAAVAADGTIYNAASDGKLYAINPDGTERWNFDTKSDIYSSPAIAQDGTVYITTYGGRVLAINPNGSKRWEFITGSEISSSPAIGADGTIYIGANGLYALNPDGSQRWLFKSDVDQRTGFGPAVVGADGTIFSVAAPNLYALKPDGTKRWAFSGDPYYSNLAVGNNGSVYVTGRNSMYAIRSKSLGLANSWAKAGRDNQYTGRSANQSLATRYVRFTGRVVNTTVSAGLAGLEVGVNQSTGQGLCRAITDNDGRYTCTAPTNEAAGFDVAFATSGQINGVPISISATASVAAGATEVQQDLSAALTTLRLAGTVKDPLGRPIVGATLSYAGRSGIPGLTTDSSGAFSTLLVYPDTQTTQTAQIVANDGKSNTSVNRTVNFTKGALSELTENFTLGRWFFEFRGKLTNALSSSPGLPGAKVLVKNGTTNLCAGNLSSSGDYVCYYTITAPLAQTFTPSYEVSYFNRVTRDGSILDLAALPLYNSNVVTQNFSLNPTTLKLSGIVRSNTGTVLAGVTVTASDVGSSAAMTTSAADGSYSLELLYPDGIVVAKPNLKAVNGQASGTASPSINLTVNAITTSPQDLTVDLNVLGSRRWVREPNSIDGAIVSGAPAIASDGTIITFGFDTVNSNTIFATNPNGTAKWNAAMFNQSVDNPSGDVVMGADGSIYAITTRVDGNSLPPLLWAYSPTDGSRKWVFEPAVAGGFYEASKTPAVASDGTVYFMTATYGGTTQANATLIGKLYAVNSSGQLRASVDVIPTALGGYFDGQVPPVIGLDGTVYVNARSKLYAFTPDLQPKWVVDLPTSSSGGWLEYEWALDWDGVLYGTSPKAGVIAINSDGTRKWFWQPTIGFPNGAGIVPYDNVLYVRVEELGTNPFKLVALERSTGLERWRINTGSNSSPIIGNNGVIYMTAPNQVTAFNTDGTSRWRFDKETASTKCNFDFSLKAPAMGKDGTLYLSDSKFCLFAVVTDTLGGLAASPWAKAFGGSQNANLIRPIPVAQLTLKLLESYGLELSIPSRAKSAHTE